MPRDFLDLVRLAYDDDIGIGMVEAKEVERHPIRDYRLTTLLGCTVSKHVVALPSSSSQGVQVVTALF